MKRLVSKTILVLSIPCASLLIAWTQAYAEATLGAGAPGQPNDTYPKFDSFDTFSMIVKVIFFLIVIIGLFFVIIKFLKQKNNFLSAGKPFRSLGGIPLGTNKSVQVVEIGKALYVIGVGDNIQLLEKIEQVEDVEAIKDMLLETRGPVQGFDSLFTWLKRTRKQPEQEMDVTSSFQQVFHSKMEGLSNKKQMVEQMLMDNKSTDRLNDNK